MNKRKREHIEERLIKIMQINNLFKYLTSNIIVDIIVKETPLEESRILSTYNDYIKEVISYSNLPENEQELILEKAELKSQEIIKCYIDEVERRVTIINIKHQVFNSILGKIWIYKIKNFIDGEQR